MLSTKLKTELKTDIKNRDDIKTFVDAFYQKVRGNDLLSPVFNAKIPGDAWPAHLERMYDFWNALLFAEKGFNGNPMQKHLALPIDEKHFEQWLGLFKETVHELFAGPKADEAIVRAGSIANIMNFKISTMQKR